MDLDESTSTSTSADGFPADALYDFRVYSLGTQLVMWATVGVVFASLTGRLLNQQPTTGRASSLTP